MTDKVEGKEKENEERKEESEEKESKENLRYREENDISFCKIV